MISFLINAEWNPVWDSPAPGRVVVSVEHCTSFQMVVRELGSAFKEDGYGEISGLRLDELKYVLESWFDKHLGSKIEIFIKGGDRISSFDKKFLTQLCLVFLGAVEAAAWDYEFPGGFQEYVAVKQKIGVNFFFD